MTEAEIIFNHLLKLLPYTERDTWKVNILLKQTIIPAVLALWPEMADTNRWHTPYSEHAPSTFCMIVPPEVPGEFGWTCLLPINIETGAVALFNSCFSSVPDFTTTLDLTEPKALYAWLNRVQKHLSQPPYNGPYPLAGGMGGMECLPNVALTSAKLKSLGD